MNELFKRIVPDNIINPNFVRFADAPKYEPARLMAGQVFESFSDVDGNFIEQLQSTGFDARIFELFLFTYFSNSGFEIDRQHKSPDFLLEKRGIRFALEATTVNPTQDQMPEDRPLHLFTSSDIKQKQKDELFIRKKKVQL